MLSTNDRLARLLAASPRKLARIDSILTDSENVTTPEADVSTCTITDAARRLRVSRPTVHRLIKAGRIRTVDLCGVRRVLVSSLIDFCNVAGK